MHSLPRPVDMFDRAWEWDVLVRFCANPSPGATLGVVSGRRRQGKSYLLEALCSATGGFYFVATEATEAESLRQLAGAVAGHLDLPMAPSLRDWEQAVDLLLAIGRETPVPVVLDEFPYLCTASPALPSIVQKALGSRRTARTSSRARLVLCGSSMTFMGGLLSGSASVTSNASGRSVNSSSRRTAMVLPARGCCASAPPASPRSCAPPSGTARSAVLASTVSTTAEEPH